VDISKRNWPTRPESSNWGDFGADENRGRLNLLTPETVRRAPAFALSLPLDLGGNGLKTNRMPSGGQRG